MRHLRAAAVLLAAALSLTSCLDSDNNGNEAVVNQSNVPCTVTTLDGQLMFLSDDDVYLKPSTDVNRPLGDRVLLSFSFSSKDQTAGAKYILLSAYNATSLPTKHVVESVEGDTFTDNGINSFKSGSVRMMGSFLTVMPSVFASSSTQEALSEHELTLVYNPRKYDPDFPTVYHFDLYHNAHGDRGNAPVLLPYSFNISSLGLDMKSNMTLKIGVNLVMADGGDPEYNVVEYRYIGDPNDM